MKIVSLTPIKLNSERVPGKNTKPLRDGTPLMTLIQRTLLKTKTIDASYVYCSQERVREYILPGVRFLRRDERFDTPDADINDMFYTFSKAVPADIYVLANATAPFLTAASVDNAVRKIAGGEHDCALSVRKMQDFFWKNGRPRNYDILHIPRTQDLEPEYMETTGLYVFTRELIQNMRTRIGSRPYLQEVSTIEAIDINDPDDFKIADAVYSYLTTRGGYDLTRLNIRQITRTGGVAA